MRTQPASHSSSSHSQHFFSGLFAIGGVFLWGSATVDAASKPAIDLTKETPAKIDNTYNLGPTGALGWMHVEAGMTENSRQILITAVENSSPAAGKLEVGDVILGVFGKPFTEDARRVFGRAIGQAEGEAARGLLPLKVSRKGTVQEIVLKLQVMGSYSETSPYNCPKAKKILEQGLVILAKNPDKDNSLHTNELALLAAGRPEDLEILRRALMKLPKKRPLWKRCGRIQAGEIWPLGLMATTIFSSVNTTSPLAIKPCCPPSNPTRPPSPVAKASSALGGMAMSRRGQPGN